MALLARDALGARWEGARVDEPENGLLTDLDSQPFSAADARPVSTVQDERLLAVELVADLVGPDQRALALPIVMLVDRAAPVGVADVRVYHSLWPLLGEHRVRPPLLEVQDMPVGGAVGAYLDAVATGDVDAAVASFAPDGCFREPSGEAYVHRGPDELRALYTAFFAAGGGVVLRHCTVLEQGHRVVLEYICDRWGSYDLPPQSGAVVFEQDDSGAIGSVHVYDDVRAPVE